MNNQEQNVAITDLIMELNTNGKTDKEISEAIYNKYSVELKTSAIKNRRARRRKNGNAVAKVETTTDNKSRNSETTYADGSKDILYVLKLTKEQKNDQDKLLEALGYNGANWEIMSSTINQWQQNSVEQGITDLYQVKIKMKPRAKNALDNMEFLKEIREVLKVVKPLAIKKTVLNEELDNDKLTFFPCPELHFNKIAYDEISSTYNLNVQKEYFNQIIERLINDQRHVKAGKLYVTIGNDFFHIDNSKATTTSGTQLSAEVHYRIMVREGTSMWVSTLMELEKYYNNIELSFMPGNHSEHADFQLYETLRYAFANNEKFNFSMDMRKTEAFKFGNNLIVTDHGEKLKKLVAKIPAMFRKEWSDSLFVWAFGGHEHHNELDRIDENGITYEKLSSPSEDDEWHYNNHFLGSLKMHQYFVFHSKYGKLSNDFIIIDKEKAMEKTL